MEARGKTQCIHFAKRNRDRETLASALTRVRGCMYTLWMYVCMCVCVLSVFVCVDANE